MNHAADEAAFLQAIREAPDDDGPRLMFADWLEERGDERAARWAELIRVQIELKQVYREFGQFQKAGTSCPDGRRSLVDRRFDALWNRSARLFGSLIDDLVPASLNRSCTFRRGFVEEVGCPLDAWLHDGPSLVARHPVRRVWISDVQPIRLIQGGPVFWTWTFFAWPCDLAPWEQQLGKLFATEQAAKEALSDVCLMWAAEAWAARPTLPPGAVIG